MSFEMIDGKADISALTIYGRDDGESGLMFRLPIPLAMYVRDRERKQVIFDEVVEIDWNKLEGAFANIGTVLNQFSASLSQIVVPPITIDVEAFIEEMLVTTQKIMIYLHPDDPPPHWQSLNTQHVPKKSHLLAQGGRQYRWHPQYGRRR